MELVALIVGIIGVVATFVFGWPTLQRWWQKWRGEDSPKDQSWTTQDKQVDQKWLDAALDDGTLNKDFEYGWSNTKKVAHRVDFEGAEVVYQEDPDQRVRWRLIRSSGRDGQVLIRKPTK